MCFAFNLMHDWRAMTVKLLLAPRYQGHSLSVQCYKFFLHAFIFLDLNQKQPYTLLSLNFQAFLQINPSKPSHHSCWYFHLKHLMQKRRSYLSLWYCSNKPSLLSLMVCSLHQWILISNPTNLLSSPKSLQFTIDIANSRLPQSQPAVAASCFMLLQLPQV